MFILVFFSGVRYRVGVDFDSYIEFIHLIGSGKDTYMEPGFELMVRILLSLGFTYQFVFLSSAIFTCFFYYLYILKSSFNYTMSVAIFALFPIFYVASFNSVRQSMAIAIFLFSLRFISGREPVKYVLAIFFGALFHSSILLMLPCYLFLNRYIRSGVLLLVAFVFLVNASLVMHLLDFLNLPVKYLIEIDSGNPIDFKSFVFVVMFLLCLFFDGRSKPCGNIVRNMLYLGAVLSVTPIFVNLSPQLILRFSNYFTPVIIVFIVNMSFNFKSGVTRLSYIVSVLVLSAIYFIGTVYSKGSSANLVPYYTNFDFF
jgi:hypothetical protein